LRGEYKSNKVARPPTIGCRHTPAIGERVISSESGTVRGQIDWLTLTPTAPPSHALRRYQRLQGSALGKWRFARVAGARTPLLAALQPQFAELRHGLCRVVMSAHRRVRTADGSVDPMAIGALAQVAASMVMEVSVPDGLEWTARGLTLEHLRRADGPATALARLDKADWSQTSLVGVPVTVGDAAGVEVARAVVSFAVAMHSD
jgi:hypothetical protein